MEAVRPDGAEIRIEAQDLPLLNGPSGKLFDPLVPVTSRTAVVSPLDSANWLLRKHAPPLKRVGMLRPIGNRKVESGSGAAIGNADVGGPGKSSHKR